MSVRVQCRTQRWFCHWGTIACWRSCRLVGNFTWMRCSRWYGDHWFHLGDACYITALENRWLSLSIEFSPL